MKKGGYKKRGGPSLRVNHRIRAREVRVIDSEGNQLGIMPPDMAIAKALDQGLDLVEMSPDSSPPVCRIMDYGRYKYDQKKKTSEAKKNQSSTGIKEIKFRPKIEAHDYNFKVDRIRRFLLEGHKAKVTMMFRGREITHQDRARDIMDRIADDAKEMGTVESFPKLEGRNMTMVMAPLAKGSQKGISPKGVTQKGNPGKVSVKVPIKIAESAAALGKVAEKQVDAVASAEQKIAETSVEA